MGSSQVFSVLTEFKFDVAGAVANSEALQKSTQKLAQAADDTLSAFSKLGYGLAGALGLGGIGAVLEGALKQSDAFQTSVLDFTSMLTTNMNVLHGSVGTFNERLAASKQIMGDIAAQADKLDLDKGQVFGMFKALMPGMAQQGVAGHNLENVTKVSGQSSGLASGLGLSQSEMASQVAAIVAGTATSGALMNRLSATKAFKGTDADTLNSSGAQERMRMLSDGLKEVSLDMGDLSERANLFSTQMKRLKTLMLGDENGMGSIFKPIGDAIRPVVVGLLKDVNGYVKVQGAQIAGSFAQLLKSFITTPKDMAVSLLQLRQSQSDLTKAGKTLAFSGTMQGIGLVLSKVTGVAMFANPAIGALAGGLSILGDILGRMHDPISQAISHLLKWSGAIAIVASVLSYFGVLWPVLAFAMSEVLVPLGLLFIMFQGISRAVAKAQVEDALHLAEILPKITEMMVRMKMALHNILVPFELAIDGISEILKPLFKWSSWFDLMMPLIDGFVSLLEFFGDQIVSMMAGISGEMSAMFNILANFKEKGIFHVFDNIGDSFNEGFNDFMAKHKQKLDDGKNVSNSITNIGKVEIRNDFKENQEPDRIAFTLKEQLLKAAQNPTQARNRSLQNGIAQR